MQSTNQPQETLDGNPFLLENDGAYRRWRALKLSSAEKSAADLIVPVRDVENISAEEHNALLIRLRQCNMAIYQCERPETVGKDQIRQFGKQLGLHRLDPNMLADDDGITSLQTEARKSDRGYIPYSDKRLLWHTDGYYNPPERKIRAMLLHCAQNAVEGGENEVLDHELVYLLMRDANPDFISALMAPGAMTIPANVEPGGEVRPAQSGPVFSLEPSTGDLHMRYTARTRSIEWKADALTRQAVEFLQSILADNNYVIRHRMQPGQGLVCNNVLHNRTAFRDDAQSGKSRLVYRARYYDRIADTHWYQLGN
ncbi:MAG: TauD/TfdA family dioxygenase [Acidiferrobacterales bacterium]|nr:TauD/TfdA family dioxygenase [Acidiferrobacterales bacterium]